MIKSVEKNLNELKDILSQSSNELYTKPSNYLFGSTIGQHVRHITDMYEIIMDGYSSGVFSFDKRKRNKILEENINEMIAFIENIISEINKKDKDLVCIVNDKDMLKTTYFRELLYCFEHGIHHQALIKVALKEFGWKNIPENFGVAPSTIKFRLACAQ